MYENNQFFNGICVKHTGKMAGMQSFSTSCTDNHFCKAYSADPEKICSKCYAQRMSKMYKPLERKNIRNGEYIKNHLMTNDEIPIINASLFRFESFGDIETVTQVVNYFNVAKKNKITHFALWTKNPHVIDYAIRLHDLTKPSNLVIIYSSPYLNKESKPNYSFIDKTFTVYSKDYAKENKISINCGARSCLTCQRCYHKGTSKQIREVLHK